VIDAPRGRPFPRGPLIAIGAIIALTLAFAIWSRIEGTDTMPPTGKPVVARDLRFVDRPDGAVLVFRDKDAEPLVIEPATNGFLRSTVRGLARERKREDVSANIPFRLTQWDDGRLTLEDPTTNRRIDLEAFGSTNAGAFAQLLTAAATEPEEARPEAVNPAAASPTGENPGPTKPEGEGAKP
jgi:putative photosynthetic complex assembly protein